MSSRAPFFIVGCPRSGTTLLQTRLDAHPDLAIPPESHIFEHFAGRFNLEAPGSGTLRAFVRALLSDPRIRRWELRISEEEFLAALPERSARGVLEHLFGVYARKMGKKNWGDKTPQHAFYLDSIRSLFPEARFIHLIRDGRDVAESLKRVFFGPKTINCIAAYWRRYIRAFQAFRSSAAQNCLEVRYEDLVSNPEREFDRIFSFLDIPAAPAGRSASREHYLSYDEIHASLAEPVTGTRVGRFKTGLSNREIEIFEAIAGAELEVCGYTRCYPQARALRTMESLIFRLQDPWLRLQAKWGHWDYLYGEIQYRLRRFFRKAQLGRRLPVLLLLISVLTVPAPAQAAQVGIKYNRPKSEYPHKALQDFERFQRDRIRTVMICLPWRQWEPAADMLDEKFIQKKLAPVLRYAQEKNIRIVLSSHCSFWGSKGDRTIPVWARSLPGFSSSSSILTVPSLRPYHISYLKRLVAATRGFPAIAGYNILNEPVAATRYYLTGGRREFDARWEGVLEIASEIRRYKDENSVTQFLIMGQHGADPGFDEKFVWLHTGRQALTPVWNRYFDKISAQWPSSLIESARYYPGRPRLRTEGTLTFAVQSRARETNWKDPGRLKVKWSPKHDNRAAVYDYDAVYEYEGRSNEAVPDLEAFYAWRIGSPDGSHRHLTFLDHRHNDRPTPYYWALRDLASAVDSFETYSAEFLPQNGPASLEFDPAAAPAGISKNWQGSGLIQGQKEFLPPVPDTTIAAGVNLEPGESVMRNVIGAHWRDNGVGPADDFVFWARTETSGEVELAVETEAGKKSARVILEAGGWTEHCIPFSVLGLTAEDIPEIRRVGFFNPGEKAQSFLLDEFLIRGGSEPKQNG